MTAVGIGSARPSNAAAVAASATVYRSLCFGPAGGSAETLEANVQRVFRSPGVLSKIGVHVVTNNRGASTYRSRINGANGAQSISVGASTTGWFVDATNTDTIAAGDKVCLQLVTGAAGSFFTDTSFTAIFAATTNTVVPWMTHGSLPVSDNTARQTGWARDPATGGAETQYQLRVRAAGSLKNLAVYISANTRDGVVTVRSRKNTANGALVVSIPASSTGFFEDSANSDALAVDDVTNWQVQGAGTTGTCTIIHVSADYETTTSQAQHAISYTFAGLAAGGTFYLHPAGLGYINGETVEANTQMVFNYPFSASGLSVRVQANSLSGGSTITSRVNGANGTQILAVGAGTTGFFSDTTHADPLTATDLLCLQVVNDAGTGTIQLRQVSLVASVAAGALASVAPTTGTVVTASSVQQINFTGTGTTWLSGTPTITPSAGSLGAITVDANNAAHATFTAPGGSGTVTFTDATDGGTTATLGVVAASTGYSLSGPATGFNNYVSEPFTVTLTPAGSAVAAAVTVTPAISLGGSVGGGAVVLTVNTPSASDTFTVTATASAAHAVSATDSGGLTDPTPITYTSADFLPNLVTSVGHLLWVKADAGVYSDAGVTPATDGQTVRQWNDQFATANHLTQATVIDRPTYAAPHLADIGGLVFEQSHSLANLTAQLGGLGALHVFVAMERADNALNRGCLLSTGEGAGLEYHQINSEKRIYLDSRAVYADPVVSHPAWLVELQYAGALVGNANRLQVWSTGRGPLATTFTGTVPAALQAADGVRLGESGLAGPNGFSGKLREVVIYDGILTATEKLALVDYLTARHHQGARHTVACIGDSQFAIAPAAYPNGTAPSQLAASMGSDWQFTNAGVSGARVQEWLTFDDTYLYAPTSGHPLNVEIFLSGRNDVGAGRTAVQVQGDLTTYWANRRAAGWIIFACTIVDSTAVDMGIVNAINAWIRLQTDKWDELCDFAADPRLDDRTDLTYFQPDQAHLTSAGLAVYAEIVEPLLEGLLGGAVRARRTRSPLGTRAGSRQVLGRY